MAGGIVKVAPVVVATLDKRSSFSQSNIDLVVSNLAKGVRLHHS